MSNNIISDFRALQSLLWSRREKLLAFMPQYRGNNSADLVEQAMTPGTGAHILLRCVCMVIAEEIARQEFLRKEAERAGEVREDDA